MSQDRQHWKKPEFVKVVPVTTAKEMFDEVTGRADVIDLVGAVNAIIPEVRSANRGGGTTVSLEEVTP